MDRVSGVVCRSGMTVMDGSVGAGEALCVQDCCCSVWIKGMYGGRGRPVQSFRRYCENREWLIMTCVGWMVMIKDKVM